jgi:DNA helicase-2/ATP-dependent DNA helicase PcrA
MAPVNWMDVSGLAQGRSEGGSEAGDSAAETLLDGLNAAQRAAVTHGDGPLLILAGAGSGKTRVITRRLAWLVATGRSAPHELLAITFTNKAAREMRERVEALGMQPGAWVSTFHALGARLLRREIEVLDEGWTRDFTIYDTHDKNVLIRDITKDLGYDVQRFRPAMVGGWISSAKMVAAEGDALEEEGGFEDEVLAKVRERYEEARRQNNALDFDDLLILTLRLFDLFPGVRDAYASRFRHVLVDEYQDTNRVQYLLTRHLASAWGNLAVCGDPDQSIYSWRGADIKNILDFEEDFGKASTVKLEQNYRSTKTILRAAQSVIRHNVSRKEKELWSAREDGRLVGVIECGDEDDEAEEILAQVRAAVAEGHSASDIAVFYRANFMQRALERAFRLGGVAYQIVGGVEFYQRREIRDLISYLRLIVNPVDDVACLRVVNVPTRGIGEKSLAAIAAWAADRRLSLSRAIASEEARSLVRGRARKGLQAFAALLERLEDRADGPAALALDAVLDETGYLEFLGQLGDADQVNREENVEELRAGAEEYDRAYPEGGLRGYLQDVALVSDVDGFDESEQRVTFMTLHAAKGLEFPVVAIAGLEEELFPHARALMEGGDEALEEERRLFYVGMTRAQDRLVLTWAGRRMHFGEYSSRLPSRFLDELPPDCVEGLDPLAEERDVLGDFEPPANADDIAVGVWVEHEHFGRGLVERLQGSGINARATVSFSAHGTKHLLLQYANLRLVEGGR